ALANEVRRIVGAADALVLRKLRIRAQGPRHIYSIISDVISGQLLRRNSRFAPSLERAYEVDLIRSRTAAAVLHAGRHEEADPVVLLRTHLPQNALVIINGVAR